MHLAFYNEKMKKAAFFKTFASILFVNYPFPNFSRVLIFTNWSLLKVPQNSQKSILMKINPLKLKTNFNNRDFEKNSVYHESTKT